MNLFNNNILATIIQLLSMLELDYVMLKIDIAVAKRIIMDRLRIFVNTYHPHSEF